MNHVKLEVEDGVALVRLDNPPVNVLSEQVATELGEVFKRCQDPSTRAVVVTGQPHFAAGADIKGFKETLEAAAEERTAETLVGAIGILEALEKPTIAAVHGYALGGGCELSLGCDFRYVAEDARIGQPEILLGLIPGAGGTQRLQRLIGFQRAKELILSGRQIDAGEAKAIGYADKVASSDELLEVALADAREWADKATLAIAAAKRALAAGLGHSVEDGLEAERAEFTRSFATADAAEGINAFVEKREAEFKGT